MANIIVRCLELGSLPTNTYVVWNKDTKECVIIDPSDGFDEIVRYIDKEQLAPKAVWLTHGHDDHIGSAADLRSRYDLLIYAMKEEEEALISIQYNLSILTGHPRVVEADMFFIDGQKVPVLGTSMTALLTPGHTVGGGCYYFPEEKIVFSGDTLFLESIGRSDFPGGDTLTLLRSVKEKLLPLPDDTVVYPGHGPATDIGHERKYNPFL